MNITEKQQLIMIDPKLHLISNDLSGNTIQHRMANKDESLNVVIYHQDVFCFKNANPAAQITELWNGYNELPTNYKLKPLEMFKKYLGLINSLNSKIAEVEMMDGDLQLRTEERDDARHWNIIYRTVLGFILLCIISYSLSSCKKKSPTPIPEPAPCETHTKIFEGKYLYQTKDTFYIKFNHNNCPTENQNIYTIEGLGYAFNRNIKPGDTYLFPLTTFTMIGYELEKRGVTRLNDVIIEYKWETLGITFDTQHIWQDWPYGTGANRIK